jgi:hypothetical protein
MKNAIRHFSTSVIAMLTLLVSFTTARGNEKNNGSGKSSEPTSIEFKYVGKLEQHPVYQLSISNADSEDYFVSFRDDEGNVLYAGSFKNTNSQRFMINVDEVGDAPLTLTVTSRKTNKSQVYSVKRSQNVVEENTVQRIR